MLLPHSPQKKLEKKKLENNERSSERIESLRKGKNSVRKAWLNVRQVSDNLKKLSILMWTEIQLQSSKASVRKILEI